VVEKPIEQTLQDAQPLSARELARRTNTPRDSLVKELDELVEKGKIKRIKRSGVHLHFLQDE